MYCTMYIVHCTEQGFSAHDKPIIMILSPPTLDQSKNHLKVDFHKKKSDSGPNRLFSEGVPEIFSRFARELSKHRLYFGGGGIFRQTLIYWPSPRKILFPRLCSLLYNVHCAMYNVQSKI